MLFVDMLHRQLSPSNLSISNYFTEREQHFSVQKGKSTTQRHTNYTRIVTSVTVLCPMGLTTVVGRCVLLADRGDTRWYKDAEAWREVVVDVVCFPD